MCVSSRLMPSSLRRFLHTTEDGFFFMNNNYTPSSPCYSGRHSSLPSISVDTRFYPSARCTVTSASGTRERHPFSRTKIIPCNHSTRRPSHHCRIRDQREGKTKLACCHKSGTRRRKKQTTNREKGGTEWRN